MKMHDQDDALSDTPKALLSLFLILLTSCFDLSDDQSMALFLFCTYYILFLLQLNVASAGYLYS